MMRNTTLHAGLLIGLTTVAVARADDAAPLADRLVPRVDLRGCNGQHGARHGGVGRVVGN